MDKKNIGSILQLIPVHIEVYKVGFELLTKAISGMGIEDTNIHWTVPYDSNFKKEYIFYDRFQFDLCSLFSNQIEQDQIDIELLEFLLR